MKQSQQAAYATSTKKNIKSQCRTYVMFCLYFKIDMFPCSEETIGLYIQFLSRSFKSVQSIRNYVNGVRILHNLHGYEFPNMDNFDLKLLLRGVSRLSQHTPKRVLPITPSILYKMCQHLNLEHPFFLAMWCSYLFAFF